MASKYRTYDQAAAQERAIRFASDVLHDDDLADDLESESGEEYADRKGLVITNSGKRRFNNLATNGMTKDELQDCVDEATDILEDVYTPESSREQLAAAVGAALAALSGDYGDEDEDEDEDEDGDDTDSFVPSP